MTQEPGRSGRRRAPRHAGPHAHRGARAVVGIVSAVLVLAFSLVAAPLPSTSGGAAVAASATGFDPGNIISDEIFFDGTALTKKQVKAFLKQQVPSCASTDPDLPCLKGWKQDTPTIAKDQFCKKYRGGSDENAAKIIRKVGKACGVSQKVILVLLQKEQSLVTSTAPTSYKYLHATGFGCPDTAPCDPDFYGFFYQVYYGARQYQRYAHDRDVFSWRDLGMNSLPYNPDTDRCGYANVDIKNYATLGLYFYTPYVPNAAALAADYGQVATGPGADCASYGNRNFWALFNDWFGSTQVPVTGAIQSYWLAHGGTASPQGAPRSVPACDASGGYCVQQFDGGWLAATKKHGTFPVSGTATFAAWQALGGTASTLGLPFAGQKCRAADGSCLQRFTGGYVVIKPNGAVRTVQGTLARLWRKAGVRKGALGIPKKNARCGKKGACKQKFRGGWIVSHPVHGSAVVSGAIADRWDKKKRQKGKFGWPLGSSTCTPKKVCRQEFQGGWIVSRSSGKVRTVRGKIARTWSKKYGKLKNPLAGQSCRKNKKRTKKTCTQHFAKGWVVTHTGRSTYIVKKKLATTWRKHRKKIGYPVAGMHCHKNKKHTKVCKQKFTKRTLVKRGSHRVKITKRH